MQNMTLTRSFAVRVPNRISRYRSASASDLTQARTQARARAIEQSVLVWSVYRCVRVRVRAEPGGQPAHAAAARAAVCAAPANATPRRQPVSNLFFYSKFICICN